MIVNDNKISKKTLRDITGWETSHKNMWLGEISIRDYPKSPIPKRLEEIFEVEKKKRGLDYVGLHYISTEDLKRACPVEIEVGELGWADYENNICHVVESELFGEEKTIEVALHELKHFYLGPHPWAEEKSGQISEHP